MTTPIVATDKGIWFLAAEARVELEGQAIPALARRNGELWALAEGRRVYRRRAGGDWQTAGESEGLRLNCLLPVGEGALAGAAEAHLVRFEEGRMVRVEGFERAEGRSEWYTPWGGPPDVRSLAAGANGDLYANVHVGGILRSADGGETWRPTIDFHADVHQVQTVAERPGLVLAAAARGLAVSADGGATWSIEREGLHASYGRAVAAAGDRLFLTASTGPFTERAAIYRRPIAGDGPFVKCEGGLPEWFADNIDSGCLAAEGDRVAFGTERGEVYLSEDAGETWTRIANGLPPVRGLILAGGEGAETAPRPPVSP
jgi:hypothetical protein